MYLTAPFDGFAKIGRYSREVFVTEKIDGTNSQIMVMDDGTIFAGSCNRWVTPENDNAGFAKWVRDHHDELLGLGKGRHFGEWWGSGIQRGYGLKNGERHFSLFNVSRWAEKRPACCDVVPVIWRGMFDDLDVEKIMAELKEKGSYAVDGFMRPEGIVIYHTGANTFFKKTFKGDDCGKKAYFKATGEKA